MRKKSNALTLFLGFLIGALGYFALDVSENGSLFKSFLFIKIPAVFSVTLIAGIIRKKQPAWNALLVSFGVFLGVVSRILIDMILDPISHDLFLFELIGVFAFILPVSFFGAYLIHGVFFIAGKN